MLPYFPYPKFGCYSWKSCSMSKNVQKMPIKLEIFSEKIDKDSGILKKPQNLSK